VTRNVARLGDIATITSGFAFKSTHFNESGDGLPLVRIRDVTVGSSETFYSGEFKEEFLLENGDALIGMDGEFNLAKWRGGKALLNQRVCKVEAADARIDQEYLIRFLPSALKKIEDRTPFVTVKHLSVKELREVEVPTPPIAEQRRIAAILDKADALRAKRREALAKLDQLLQSVFLDVFGDPIENPKNWPLELLGEMCDVRDGTHDSPKYVDRGHPLVTSKNLSSGEVKLDGALLISNEDFIQINRRSRVDKGDLLMPMIGTIGNPVLVDHEPNYAIKNIALLKFHNARVTNTYILHLLRSHFFERVTAQKNRGGTQKFLALKDIRGMQVPVPDSASQILFDDRLRAISEQRSLLLSSICASERLFAGLQSQAFKSGFQGG
jgi:type I restriction enzyme S subunit